MGKTKYISRSVKNYYKKSGEEVKRIVCSVCGKSGITLQKIGDDKYICRKCRQ